MYHYSLHLEISLRKKTEIEVQCFTQLGLRELDVNHLLLSDITLASFAHQFLSLALVLTSLNFHVLRAQNSIQLPKQAFNICGGICVRAKLWLSS